MIAYNPLTHDDSATYATLPTNRENDRSNAIIVETGEEGNEEQPSHRLKDECSKILCEKYDTQLMQMRHSLAIRKPKNMIMVKTQMPWKRYVAPPYIKPDY